MIKLLIGTLTIYLTVSTAVGIEIDRKVLNAIKHVESGGRPKAESPCGARGLYQIMRSTWDEFANGVSFDKAYDPVENEKVAKRYLEWINKTLTKWMGREPTVEDVAACFNGGIGRYRKNSYDIKKMPKETREYVVKINKEFNRQ